MDETCSWLDRQKDANLLNRIKAALNGRQVLGHSVLQIFYTTSEQRDYAEERSVRALIYRGRNLLMVELPPGVAGRLRVDPGEIPGEYRLYRIELSQ